MHVEVIARAIMAAKAEGLEEAAKLIEAESTRILSKQDGKDAQIDANLRLMACILPSLADAIRKRGEG